MTLLEYHLDDVRREVHKYVDEYLLVSAYRDEGEGAAKEWCEGPLERQALRDLVDRILDIAYPVRCLDLEDVGAP